MGPGAQAPTAISPSSPINLAVKRGFGKPPVVVQVTLPGGWTEGKHDEVVRLLPKVQPDRFHLTELQLGEGNASCQGPCDAKQIMANIIAVHESFRNRLATPNRNTGDPKKDDYRAKVEVLEDFENKGKEYRRVFSAKVTCPDKGAIPCMPRMAARCFFYEAGSDFYLVATGQGPLAAESVSWKQLMAICKGFAIGQKQ